MGLVGLCALAGCGGDDPAGPDTAPDTGPGDAWVVDLAPPRDTAAPAPTFTLHAPTPVPGAPFPLILTTPEPLTATVALTVGAEAHAVHLYRGRGSVVLRLTGTAPVPVALDGADYGALTPVVRPRREVGGALVGDALRWGPEADIVLTRTATVAVGDTLELAAGTRVLVAPGVNLELQGALRSAGTEAAPVLFTAEGGAGGGLRLTGDAATAELGWTWWVAAGGDASHPFGHSNSQPVVWVDGATLVMTGGGVLDSPGKAFGTRDAAVTLRDVTVARCDTGGEFERTPLLAEGLHVSEIPDADGRVDDDDNDGIYLVAPPRGDGLGAPEAVLRDVVFAVGEDDAIDHNGAVVRIERAWIMGFAHEGVAASTGGRVTVVDSVITGCDQGVEAGYGAPEVRVERTTLTGNGTGLRFGDSYDWEDLGSLVAIGVIVHGNGIAVRNFARGRGGPRPGALVVRCSVLDDLSWVGVDGNVAGPPEGAWEAGCATGPALDVTQCNMTIAGPACAISR